MCRAPFSADISPREPEHVSEGRLANGTSPPGRFPNTAREKSEHFTCACHVIAVSAHAHVIMKRGARQTLPVPPAGGSTCRGTAGKTAAQAAPPRGPSPAMGLGRPMANVPSVVVPGRATSQLRLTAKVTPPHQPGPTEQNQEGLSPYSLDEALISKRIIDIGAGRPSCPPGRD